MNNFRSRNKIINKNIEKVKELQESNKEQLLQQFKNKNKIIAKNQKPIQIQERKIFKKKEVKKNNNIVDYQDIQNKLKKAQTTIKNKSNIIDNKIKQIKNLKQQLKDEVNKNKILKEENFRLLQKNKNTLGYLKQIENLKNKNEILTEEIKQKDYELKTRKKHIHCQDLAIQKRNQDIIELSKQIKWEQSIDYENQIKEMEDVIKNVYFYKLKEYEQQIETLKKQLYKKHQSNHSQIQRYQVIKNTKFLAQIYIGDKNRIYIKNSDGDIIEYTKILPYSFEYDKIMAVCQMVENEVKIIQLYPNCNNFTELMNLLTDKESKKIIITNTKKNNENIREEHMFKTYNGEKVAIITAMIKMKNIYSNIFKMANLKIDFWDINDKKTLSKINKLGQYDIVINHTGTTSHQIKDMIFASQWYKHSDAIYDEMEELTLNRLMQRINYLITNFYNS